MKDIGILLQQARESRDLKIADAASSLKIRRQYLEALESGDISHLDGQIYLSGYLKSYANWLGLNGSEITSQIKKGSNGFTMGNAIGSDGSSYFLGEYNLALPEKNLFVITFVVLIVTYVFWSNMQSENAKYVINADSPVNKSKSYKGFSYPNDDPRTLIFLANGDVDVTSTKLNGSQKVVSLKANEMYFLPNERDVFITVDKPEYIDVFIDDDKNSFLGNFAQISK